ncbi:MAG: M23 family metallopeptidase, partial [Patescibacteria group bacterium]
MIYRGVASAFGEIELALKDTKSWLPKTRTSNPVSALLRPVFEAKRLRPMLGANLAAAVVMVSVVGTPIRATNATADTEVVALPVSTVVITELGFEAPVPATDVSQWFSRFHPGVDLRAPLGTPVRPVGGGRVVRVEISRWGYGKLVIVEHEKGLVSFYAHLRKINVEENQPVSKETVLGEVGLTGWTTG